MELPAVHQELISKRFHSRHPGNPLAGASGLTSKALSGLQAGMKKDYAASAAGSAGLSRRYT